MENIVAIVQARMGSNRLPGKMLKKVGKHYLVEKIIKKLSLSKQITKLVFALPDTKIDDPLAAIIKKHNISVYRGSENDVLDRYYKTACEFKADIIIRICGDCPLIDANILDDLILTYKNNNYDYVSNVWTNPYPMGFGGEVFSFDTLEKIWQKSKLPEEREHVTEYINTNRNEFKIYDKPVPKSLNRPNYKICVDTEKDFLFISKIFEAFNDRIDMDAEEIVIFLDNNSELLEINK